MKFIVIAITIVTVLAVLISILKPLRVLSIYAITRPIAHPFIFLQYKLFIIPYAYIWAFIIPLCYVTNYFSKGWRLICYKSMPLFIILCLSILSIALSIDIKASIEGTIRIMIMFFAFGIAYNSVKSRDDVDMVVRAVVFASIIPLLYGFYQVITGHYDQVHFTNLARPDSGFGQRVSSVFGFGNTYGIFLTITMVAVMITLLNRVSSKKLRWFYLTLLGAMVTSQVLALNRGTWIAFTVSIFVALLPYRKKVKVRWFVIGFLIIGVVFSGAIYKRFMETKYTYMGTEKDTFQGRIDYWRQLAPKIMERPILGHGIGTVGLGITKDTRHDPHNDYIRLAMDIGLLGSLIYLYFLSSLAFFFLRRQGIHNTTLWRYNFPMAVLATYMLVISSTQNIIYNVTNFVLFMMLNGAVIKYNVLESRKAGPVRQKITLGRDSRIRY